MARIRSKCRSRDNPILLWIEDAKIVRDLITVGAPVRPFPALRRAGKSTVRRRPKIRGEILNAVDTRWADDEFSATFSIACKAKNSASLAMPASAFGAGVLGGFGHAPGAAAISVGIDCCAITSMARFANYAARSKTRAQSVPLNRV